MDPIESIYLSLTPKSAAVQQRAARVMPGGDTRSSVFHRPYSLTIARAAGSRMWDVDGNEYIDLNNNYTALVHGHAYPPIVKAAREAMDRGTTWSAKNVYQVELAELIVDRIASVDAVRFANSSTEASLLALAIARAATGRRKILMARWGFHGQHEAFNDAYFRGQQEPWPDTFIAEFGDAASFAAVLKEYGSEIAAVFLEPIMGSAGIVSAPREFFADVQAACAKAGALFVLDEATVQRLSPGGCQAILGIQPDLTMLGKVIGGGFPVGGVGGRLDVMDIVDASRHILNLSGTFAGNPVTMAAGIASVTDLTAERTGVMAQRLALIDRAIAAAAAEQGLPYSSRVAGSLLNVYFSAEPPPANQLRTDGELVRAFHLAALTRGVFIAPRALINTSSVLTDQDAGLAAEKLQAAVADVAASMCDAL
jgi:glutamate-1-semialdehyde 2,1-aminomutase